jgi:hypothetical protein
MFLNATGCAGGARPRMGAIRRRLAVDQASYDAAVKAFA